MTRPGRTFCAALVAALALAPRPSPASPADSADAPGIAAEASGQPLADQQAGSPVQFSLYGYFSVRLEKTLSEPTLEDGQVVRVNSPAEWSYPYFHLMMQNRISRGFKAFVNLSGDGSGKLEVRNAWGEGSPNRALHLRVGRIYRHFGLYNEVLDAVPSYFGIEPPELFDPDHLILSRTTSFMLHGTADIGRGSLCYALSTDNGEGDAAPGLLPVQADVNYELACGTRFGLSAYTSGGETGPDVAVGDGSPKSGVLPWMAADRFSVFGGYLESQAGRLTVQAEFWKSPHRARRDPEAVAAVVDEADLNPRQLGRFLVDPGAPASAENVIVPARYDVRTWYVRAGYSVGTTLGEFVPYVQWDWYSNPETIAPKKYGGDNEAGLADDGKFNKATVGVVLRPVPEVAVKLDASSHIYRFEGRRYNVPEIRLDVSYVFGH